MRFYLTLEKEGKVIEFFFFITRLIIRNPTIISKEINYNTNRISIKNIKLAVLEIKIIIHGPHRKYSMIFVPTNQKLL
jgi:hypothetical protein